MGDTPTGKVVGSVVPVLVMAIATFMILNQLQIAPEIVTITYAALLGGAVPGDGARLRPRRPRGRRHSMLVDAYSKARAARPGQARHAARQGARQAGRPARQATRPSSARATATATPATARLPAPRPDGQDVRTCAGASRREVKAPARRDGRDTDEVTAAPARGVRRLQLGLRVLRLARRRRRRRAADRHPQRGGRRRRPHRDERARGRAATPRRSASSAASCCSRPAASPTTRAATSPAAWPASTARDRASACGSSG